MYLLLQCTDLRLFSHSVHILLPRLTLSALGVKLNDYWNALKDKQSRGGTFQAGGEEESASDE